MRRGHAGAGFLGEKRRFFLLLPRSGASGKDVHSGSKDMRIQTAITSRPGAAEGRYLMLSRVGIVSAHGNGQEAVTNGAGGGGRIALFFREVALAVRAACVALDP